MVAFIRDRLIPRTFNNVAVRFHKVSYRDEVSPCCAYCRLARRNLFIGDDCIIRSREPARVVGSKTTTATINRRRETCKSG